MNRRAGLVGLFLGAAIMVGVWFVLPASEQSERQAKPGKPPIFKKGKIDPARLKAVPLDRAPDLSLRTIAARQESMQNLVSVDGEQKRDPARMPGVFHLDQDGIATAISLRQKDLQACYETALFHTPDLAGTMTLEMKVEPAEGQPYAQITSVEVESDLDAKVFEGCVATVVEELKFHAEEPTTIRYPMVFESVDDE